MPPRVSYKLKMPPRVSYKLKMPPREMISLAPESTFDPSDSLFSTMDGECSAIIKLNPPLKRLEDCDSTMDGECSTIIKLNPPLKRLEDCDSTMDGECSTIIKLNPPLKRLEDCDSTMGGECSAVIKPNLPLKRMKILDSTISTRSEVIVGNIHPSNMDDVEHLNNSLSNPGSPLDRSTPISDCDIAETEVGTSTLENSPIQAMEVSDVEQEKKSVAHQHQWQKQQCKLHQLPGTSCKYTSHQ